MIVARLFYVRMQYCLLYLSRIVYCFVCYDVIIPGNDVLRAMRQRFRTPANLNTFPNGTHAVMALKAKAPDPAFTPGMATGRITPHGH